MGGTTVEHWIPRSHDASAENDYENCLYACRYCNRSRSAQPLRRGATRLLDPTRDAWSAHFAASVDDLLPFGGDDDAEYTLATYELNDPRKVARRRARRELITDRLELLARFETDIAELLRLADLLRRRDLRRFGALLQELKDIRADARRAWQDLARYLAVPTDAPRTCRCPGPPEHSLPEELERQTLELPDALL